MVRKKILEFKKGQTQLLLVMGLGVAMLTGALFMLEYSRQLKSTKLRVNWQSEMRTAIESAVKHASDVYRVESGCDPVVFAEKLGRMEIDGSINNSGAATRAQMNITVNDRTYVVSFGKVSRIPWEDGAVDPSLPWNKGTSQDAIVEVWTTMPGSFITMIQQAALLNNCNYPCSVVDGEVCTSATNRGIAYGQITDTSKYPIGTTSNPGGCGGAGARRSGSLRVDPTNVFNIPTTSDVRDLMILKNYLRSGDTQGSSTSVMNGIMAFKSCADYNLDSIVDDRDLSAMEKYLRGYLFWTRTRTFSK